MKRNHGAAVRQAIQATEDLVKHQQTLSEMRYDAADAALPGYAALHDFCWSCTFLLVILIAIRF